MAKKMSQRQRVLHHLQTRGALTALQALQFYGISRLDNRIRELRKQGHDIEQHYVERINRYQETIRVAQYRISK